MTMSPRWRRLALTTHVTTSVGWAGALVAYLCLALAGLSSGDVTTMRSAYIAMELLGWFVIVPFSVGSLSTGLVESLGTEWGLLRHHWVRTKFVLTVIVTTVLFAHMATVRRMSAMARHLPSFESADLGMMRIQLVVHAIGGLLVLLAATALSFYKPWGRTAYGERVAQRAPRTGAPSVPKYALLAVVAVIVAIAIAVHLHGGGLRHH